MKKIITTGILLFLSSVAWADYSNHAGAKAFVDKMVNEHKFDAQEVKALLAKAERKQSILDAISRPAEKTKEWFEYRDIFVQESRIKQGVEFWQEHQTVIEAASEKFGVAPEIIVAIIGVETRYGRHAGKYRVLDALATLGFDYPKRGKFFLGQLEAFMLMTREQEQEPTSLYGSYAGAMGYGQFIPSSYRAYAVDFDGDDKVDIWKNPADAIGSVANYFKAHRWKEGQPVFSQAKAVGKFDENLLNSKKRPELTLADLKKAGFEPKGNYPQDLKAVPLSFIGDNGKEYWIGFDNFYVITRYNRSHLYAMAVWHLSQEIKQRIDSTKS